MTENVIEQLVEKNETKGTKFTKVILIALTVLSVLIVFPMLTIIFVFIDMFVFGRMKVEYEYTYFMGDLDIDRVTNKSTRKKVFSTNFKDVDLIAPTGAPELLGYQRLKVINCSTMTPGNQTYEMIAKKGEDKVRVVFEPNNDMLEAMHRLEPRKVIF